MPISENTSLRANQSPIKDYCTISLNLCESIMSTVAKIRVGRFDLVEGDGKKTLRAVPSKGLLWVHIDGLSNVHFSYYDREDGGVSMDTTEEVLARRKPVFSRAVLPGSAICEKMSHGSSRILSLKIRNEETIHFWSQEPNGERDDEVVESIRHALNRFAGDMEESKRDLEASSSGPVSRIHLQTVLQNIMSSDGPMLHAMIHSGHPNKWLEPYGDLAEVFTEKRMQVLLLSNPRAVKKLQEQLPQELQDEHDIIKLMSQPHFKQQVQVLNEALNSGHLNGTHFGLKYQGQGVAGLYKAILKGIEENEHHCAD
jgi:hypothetical protein